MAEAFFQATAWTMDTPKPYGAFHLVLTVLGVSLSIFLARKFSFPERKAGPDTILFLCGLFLGLTELYKQGFIYYIENGRTYDWWYFPFQLCSIPMYLCLLLPFIKPRMSCRCVKAVHTFLQDFALLGGVMALAEPSGLMHPFLVLTLHGFIWHFILIFIGLYCAFAGLGGQSLSEFADTLPFFCGCAAAATFINVASHPYGNADMFYISPYYPNGQVVFHQIALTIGTVPGNILYLLSVVLGGFLFHVMLRHIPRQC